MKSDNTSKKGRNFDKIRLTQLQYHLIHYISDYSGPLSIQVLLGYFLSEFHNIQTHPHNLFDCDDADSRLIEFSNSLLTLKNNGMLQFMCSSSESAFQAGHYEYLDDLCLWESVELNIASTKWFTWRKPCIQLVKCTPECKEWARSTILKSYL